MPPKVRQEKVILGDYFVSEEELKGIIKDNSFQQKMTLQAKQSVIDSDYLKLMEWRDHPERFIEEVFGVAPWTCPDADDQLDIILALKDHDRVTVRSGNGPGKTWLAGRIVLQFLCCNYPSIVVTTAPTGRQVEKLLWGEIRSAYKGAAVDFGGEIFTKELRLADNWYALGFSTDEPEKFQGFHSPNLLVVVDEAGGVEEAIFEAIEGLLTTAGAKILLIGNPLNPASFFGRTHLHPRESKGWFKLHIDNYNTPNVRAGENILPGLVSYDWPEKKRKQWGVNNPFFQVRVKGNFPESGEDNLVPYHMVHSAIERSIAPAGKKILGVDVAWMGNDKSVIGRLWGDQFRILRKLYKMRGPELANRIVRVIKEEGTEVPIEEVKIDIIGWGSDCYSSLREKKYRGTKEEKSLLKKVKIIPVNVAEKVKSSKARKDYYNVRAEAAFIIRNVFEEGQIDIDDEDLGVQLANIKYKFLEGRYLLEEKIKFKKRFRESPDELDSLLIAKAIVSGGVPHVW